MPKKKTPALAKRKKNPPKTAYTKENPSPFAFQPGVSGNPTGKSKVENYQISKGLKVRLNTRAPAAVCTALGLPITSSWRQVQEQRLLLAGASGEIAAIRLMHEMIEPKGGTSINVGVAIGANGEPVSTAGPDRIGLVFVSSDGNGNISEKSLKEMADIDKHYERQGYQAIHGVGVTRYVLKDCDSPEGDSPEDDCAPVIDGEMLGPE
jgi:hypothetical protein